MLCVLQGSRNAIDAGEGRERRKIRRYRGTKVREDRMMPVFALSPESQFLSLTWLCLILVHEIYSDPGKESLGHQFQLNTRSKGYYLTFLLDGVSSHDLQSLNSFYSLHLTPHHNLLYAKPACQGSCLKFQTQRLASEARAQESARESERNIENDDKKVCVRNADE